jgi:hypothetical protein
MMLGTLRLKSDKIEYLLLDYSIMAPVPTSLFYFYSDIRNQLYRPTLTT